MLVRHRTLILSFALLALGLGGAWLLMASKPTARRAAPQVSTPLVLTAPASRGTTKLTLTGLGTVKAAQETVIRTRVPGTVLEIGPHFEPGDQVQTGELLVRIDPADYANTVRLKESALAKARADYDLEMGQQTIARAEYEQLRKNLNSDLKNTLSSSALALRVPHLAQAKADLAAAQTNLDQARLELERTAVTAPFNGLILERTAAPGDQASTSEKLGTLVGTDVYWVEAAFPLDQLHALGLDTRQGTPAKIHTSTGQVVEGTVLRSLGALDAATRMGRVLVAVSDPLGLAATPPRPPLLLGDQVRVELVAGKLEDVIVLPRTALRGGDKVWVAKDARLDIRPVEVAWKDAATAYLKSGLEPGEPFVLSDLSAPIQGMPLRVTAQQEDKAEQTANAGPPVDQQGEKPLRTGADPRAEAKP